MIEFINKILSHNKKLTLFIACILQTNFINGQIANYISNGSMEIRYDCNVPNLGRKAKYWRGVDSINEAIDYNSVCYGNIPLNGYTYQFPKDGDSYFLTAFLCQPPSCTTINNRIYFRNRLKSNLVNGKTYCVKFFVNISDNSSYGIDGFGAYFGDNSLDTITYGNIPLTYITPQVQNPTGNIITDTLNWTLITGTFVANGTEKHCVIGNFKSDAATNKILINTINAPNVYCNVLLDDVSCIPIDLPAYAGADVYAPTSTTVYIGRPQDVGIDEACTWYNLTNTTTAIANAAGITLTVTTTQSYMVKQNICGIIKYDTVIVYASGVGLNSTMPEALEGGVTIYPNPANEVINVECLVFNNEAYKIEIINALGQVIREEEITFKNNVTSINTKELQNGVYVLSLRVADEGGVSRSENRVINKRFVISR